MAFVPIGDDNTDRRTVPVVNYVLIALNVLVFVLFQQLGTNDRFTYAYSVVPKKIISGHDVELPPLTGIDPETGRRVTVEMPRTPIHVYLTIFTAMFMHGGFLHLAGNMLFLWIFGDNIEDAMGHVRYVFFYLLGGIVATLSQVLVSTSGDASTIPSLGASGAISTVLGGYLILFPKRRVRVLMFRTIMEVPAIAAIGIWFLFQLVESFARPSGGGGVAYAAHIGGFIAGLALVKPFMIGAGSGRTATDRHFG